jgi:hypothetical protein
MAIETQEHLLQARLTGDDTLTISRNGNHQYWTHQGTKVPSVTTMATHVDEGSFGAAMGWTLNQIKDNGGDLGAPNRISKQAMEDGNQLHAAIDAYIQNGTIAEGNPLFIAWLHEVGEKHDWLDSEQFIYHEGGLFGGTLDALSRDKEYPHRDDSISSMVWDWKTVDPKSWAKHGSTFRHAKDSAQLAAYASALQHMGSIYVPTRGCIAYIMRDASAVVVEEVDLAWGWRLFQASHIIYNLRKDGR